MSQVLKVLRSKTVQGAILSGLSAAILLFGNLSGAETIAAVERGVELAGLFGAILAAYGRTKHPF